MKAKTGEQEYRKSIQSDIINKHKISRDRVGHITWRAPSEGWLKANVDAAFRAITRKAATAVVIRDTDEKLLLGVTEIIASCSALAAEANAIRNSMIIISNLGLSNVLIELDCLLLIQALKSKGSLGEVDLILMDIAEMKQEVFGGEFTWIKSIIKSNIMMNKHY
ncbi:hypothetical protein AHAS_Ahas11G0278600 [Arachis hypogaea]